MLDPLPEPETFLTDEDISILAYLARQPEASEHEVLSKVDTYLWERGWCVPGRKRN